ncbi:MAG: putative molybdenum carrier protein [Stellaceae bacterium]
MIEKIVSGGQTGVDRAALDVAIRRGIPHGGYCPKGRRSDSGRISDKYNLIETSSGDYPQRTAANVQHSDGTLIITRGAPIGGTKRTIHYCRDGKKPRFVVDLRRKLKVQEFVAWISENEIRVLNVAGPRESGQPGIGKAAQGALDALFAALLGPFFG